MPNYNRISLAEMCWNYAIEIKIMCGNCVIINNNYLIFGSKDYKCVTHCYVCEKMV